MYYKTKAKLAYSFHSQKLFKTHYLFDINNKTLISKTERGNHLFIYNGVLTLYLRNIYVKENTYDLKDIITILKNDFI